LRDRWYSDNRDLVKWGALFHLAESSKCRAILQIVFYRPEADWPFLQKDEHEIPFPDVVLKHFRDVEQIKHLCSESRLTIKVFKESLDGSRESYVQKILETLQIFHDQRLIVFLDPDTGLAPKTAGLEHVRPDELLAIYSHLKPQDWLVLYQHRQRRRDWIEYNRRKFVQALDLPRQSVKTFSSLKLASDVVLFAAQSRHS
jgi:hypothetical protein